MTGRPATLLRHCSRMTRPARWTLISHALHCFNATFDSVENRWKALQNYELLRARKFAENAYYHELARELRSFGYSIRNQARGDFQIEGVSDELCERFSKRHTEIEKAFARLLELKTGTCGWRCSRSLVLVVRSAIRLTRPVLGICFCMMPRTGHF